MSLQIPSSSSAISFVVPPTESRSTYSDTEVKNAPNAEVKVETKALPSRLRSFDDTFPISYSARLSYSEDNLQATIEDVASLVSKIYARILLFNTETKKELQKQGVCCALEETSNLVDDSIRIVFETVLKQKIIVSLGQIKLSKCKIELSTEHVPEGALLEIVSITIPSDERLDRLFPQNTCTTICLEENEVCLDINFKSKVETKVLPSRLRSLDDPFPVKYSARLSYSEDNLQATIEDVASYVSKIYASILLFDEETKNRLKENDRVDFASRETSVSHSTSAEFEAALKKRIITDLSPKELPNYIRLSTEHAPAGTLYEVLAPIIPSHEQRALFPSKTCTTICLEENEVCLEMNFKSC